MMPYLVDESVSFAIRLLERSGLCEETCVPEAYHYMPPDRSLEASRDETELVIFSVVDEVFARTSVKPEEIDVLIVNCSIFTPTPVFADMVVNRYKLRADVQNVNLSGMGCSAGLVSVGLAKNLLQTARPGTHVLIVSTEILSSQYYVGTERAMLLPNCLFRMGAAAMILSNSSERARYRLTRLVRTVTAARDADYRCVFQEEDDKGNTGIRLSKDLATTAGHALKTNIAAFGPLVLPASEQLLVALSLLKRKLLSGRAKVRLYRPDFRTAFEHICIHAGGRGVIDEVQHGLGLSDQDVEASRMTLHRFGNTSSSSVLYELAYIEAKGMMKKGDRIWMISFGAGFDCNSVAWECVKPPADADGPWVDSIHRYPVQLPGIVKDTSDDS
jgi:3-ketoacyl-CoA synthase